MPPEYDHKEKEMENRKTILILFYLVMLMLLMAGIPFDLISAQTPEATRAVDGSGAISQSVWTLKRWSPYVAGIGIGILSWLAFLLSDKPLGVSTAYARTAGMIEQRLTGIDVKKQPYFERYVPKIGWEWMLVAGLVVGAFVSAQLSGDFDLRMVPSLWERTFGYTPSHRWFTALVGGTLMGIGSRWADGCTSGHGISGTLQLVVSSWIALACFFIGGVAAAFLIY